MITAADVERVARQNDLPLVVAWGLAADAALCEAVRGRRRDLKTERRSNWLRLTACLLEREERGQ